MPQQRNIALRDWCYGCLVVALSPGITSSAIHQALEQLGEWKQQAGFVFAATSTGLFGGLIPSLIHKVTGKSDSGAAFVLSNSLFWALKGIEIELLYRFQAWLFGDRTDWTVVAAKTAFDQIVYVTTIGLVNVVLFYLWRDCRYDFDEFRHRLGRNWYVQRVLPVLISNWLIWIPAVILIYCFPLALQLPVQNLILCFWVLILTILTDKN